MTTSPDPAWVDAAPFRAHVHHLCAATGLPWQLVGAAADVPQRQMATLMRGRAGRPRPRLLQDHAHRLLSLTPASLQEQRRIVTLPAEAIALLEDLGGPDPLLARRLGCDEAALRALAARRVSGIPLELLWRLRAGTDQRPGAVPARARVAA